MKTTGIISIIFFLFLLTNHNLSSQEVFFDTDRGLTVSQYIDREGWLTEVRRGTPLFSFHVDGIIYNTLQAKVNEEQDRILLDFNGAILCEIIPDTSFNKGWKAMLKIHNHTGDTIDIENIVPFGESRKHLYITSTGPWALARARLFRPGLGPVGLILPDNAWELGYAQIPLGDSISLGALARRTVIDTGEKRRYRTTVYPDGILEYVLYLDDFKGAWQNGLKQTFQERYLYDLEEFDNTLFEREDLQWIRHDYLIGLEFAWNKDFYDWQRQQYHFFSFLEEGMFYYGGYDVFGLWPTWPRLGVDHRNQWDLFSDLPGGLDRILDFSRKGKKMGTNFFICYNPWDESTRQEDPYKGMATLIEALDADGVVLDCHGWSSKAYQKAADSIKPGVIMYSEGMAVIRDMPGIVSGRVHNAIYLSPPLNLNKLIKPDFAIFRVCELKDKNIRREAAIAFFNGYGTELNSFAPGLHDNSDEDMLYLGKSVMTLRENTSNFLTYDWTPLIPTTHDSIWVNRWPKDQKTIFTVFSLVPEGFQGPLFHAEVNSGYHAVSLWHHMELSTDTLNGKTLLPARLSAFNAYDLGTRAEGSLDCIAILPDILDVDLHDGKLAVTGDQGDEIRVWAGMPTYQNPMLIRYRPGRHELNLMELFGDYNGKIVVQLLDSGELLDEKILLLEAGNPRLLSPEVRSKAYSGTPEGMVKIPAGLFQFHTRNTDHFIPYPQHKGETIAIESYFIDQHPVTNSQFKAFLDATSYRPTDTNNFLKHWTGGKIPENLEDHPVVYVCLEDARAYAAWAGKRLPTEAEWQYAGQGNGQLIWPWGNEMDSSLCNYSSGHTTPVDTFTKGKSPFGVIDMIGNVWQLTADVYDNGTYYYVIMKGGSHYHPTSSWWYVKGGPQPLEWTQQLLLVSPGFDRNSTVGFRCAADVKD